MLCFAHHFVRFRDWDAIWRNGVLETEMAPKVRQMAPAGWDPRASMALKG